jgi:hypothetical protein
MYHVPSAEPIRSLNLNRQLTHEESFLHSYICVVPRPYRDPAPRSDMSAYTYITLEEEEAGDKKRKNNLL